MTLALSILTLSGRVPSGRAFRCCPIATRCGIHFNPSRTVQTHKLHSLTTTSYLSRPEY
ncbi:MAG: hypothetical protein ACMV0Y_00720 [Paludibacter sp.]